MLDFKELKYGNKHKVVVLENSKKNRKTAG